MMKKLMLGLIIAAPFATPVLAATHAGTANFDTKNGDVTILQETGASSVFLCNTSTTGGTYVYKTRTGSSGQGGLGPKQCAMLPDATYLRVLASFGWTGTADFYIP